MLNVYFYDSGNECVLKNEEPTIHQEDIAIKNIHEPNSRAPKYRIKRRNVQFCNNIGLTKKFVWVVLLHDKISWNGRGTIICWEKSYYWPKSSFGLFYYTIKYLGMGGYNYLLGKILLL